MSLLPDVPPWYQGGRTNRQGHNEVNPRGVAEKRHKSTAYVLEIDYRSGALQYLSFNVLTLLTNLGKTISRATKLHGEISYLYLLKNFILSKIFNSVKGYHCGSFEKKSA